MPIRKSFNATFFDAWSPEMAYVLGFMFADGAVWQGQRKNWFFAFYSTDEEIIYDIRKALQSEHKIGERAQAAHTAWEARYVLQIGSKKFARPYRRTALFRIRALLCGFLGCRKNFLAILFGGISTAMAA